MEQRTWIRCTEIPLNVWGDECFFQITTTIREFLKAGEMSTNMENVEYARLLVRIPNYKQMLYEKMEVNINGHICHVRLIEEDVSQVNQCSCWLKHEDRPLSGGLSVGSQYGHNEWLIGLGEENYVDGSLEEEYGISKNEGQRY
ncbi:hypothetical protein VNO78_30786 [Psophocarpus tetragonolobus]|uniref:DUF4283 domain-containing protein n=1 Tax=Psophocarpus tetragonolobus TaxID=3891 RepID=A0AAN9X820_PSOTE